MAGLYESCLESSSCEHDCLLTYSGTFVCGQPCRATADCPIPAEISPGTTFTGVECVEGSCLPYRACPCPDDEFCYGLADACVPRQEDGTECHADEQCFSTYCDPANVFSGYCRAPIGSECVAGVTDCDCSAAAEGAIGYCTGSCYATADGSCICRAEGFASNGSRCLPRCTSSDECRDGEDCEFDSPTDLYGWCVGPRFTPNP